jgi:hypothetical protein
MYDRGVSLHTYATQLLKGTSRKMALHTARTKMDMSEELLGEGIILKGLQGSNIPWLFCGVLLKNARTKNNPRNIQKLKMKSATSLWRLL